MGSSKDKSELVKRVVDHTNVTKLVPSRTNVETFGMKPPPKLTTAEGVAKPVKK